jgi:hypothetical protein
MKLPGVNPERDVIYRQRIHTIFLIQWFWLNASMPGAFPSLREEKPGDHGGGARSV